MTPQQNYEDAENQLEGRDFNLPIFKKSILNIALDDNEISMATKLK